MKEGIINYAVYEDETEFIGIADATLPDLKRITTEIQGSGMNGIINSPIIGNIEAMETTLNFKAPSREQSSLFEGRKHRLTFMQAVQNRNLTSGEIEVEAHKIVMEVTPNTQSLGKVATASTSDASGTYAVNYFAQYFNGVKTDEIDILNFICMINGKDELADVRRALGK